MRHRQRTLLEDDAAGWPNSLYHGNELLTPFDAPLTVLELDGGHRTPHNPESFGSGPLRFKCQLD